MSKYKVVIPRMDQNSSYINAHEFLLSLGNCGLSTKHPHSFAPVFQAARLMNRLRLFGRVAKVSGITHVVFVGYNQVRAFAPIGTCSELVPWCLDTWPGEDKLLDQIIKRYGIKRMALSQRMSCSRIMHRHPSLDICWIPESADQHHYNPSKDLHDRSMILLEYGREIQDLSIQISRECVRQGWSYSSTANARKAYPTGAKLHEAIGNSRSIVAFPRSITHPRIAQGCETMTLRYLEGVASRTLVLGQSPQELIDLFGFDPVIPLNQDNSVPVLRSLSEIPESYQDHVNRAYERFLEVGTHDIRGHEFVQWLKFRKSPQYALRKVTQQCDQS